MNAETSPQLPYNGDMLKWAREWRGRSPEEAAQRAGVTTEKLLSWEAGTAFPTVRQARSLADFYDRAFLEFFYDSRPVMVESELIPDYRTHKAEGARNERELLAIQHWAELQRINALDLFEDVDEPIPVFPSDLTSSLGDDVERVAVRARQVLGLSLAEQQRMTYEQRKALPSLLRGRMEKAGVLVLRENELAKYGVAGMVIAQFPLPVIVYAAQAPARSAFTLLHEFGHLVLRGSAISGPERVRHADSHAKRIEKWCDKFAAAFLIPKAELEELRPLPAKPVASIDDTVLAAIARHFRVSQHAMLVRLVDLGHVRADYYWEINPPYSPRRGDGLAGVA